MARNIKGITIEFRGDTTKLDKALRQVDKETKNIDSELKKVDSALKFNPGNIDLWRQKQTLLSQKVKETEERLKTLKAAQKQMDGKEVDKNSAEYRNLQREIITTESKLKNFKNQLRGLNNVNLKALSMKFNEIGKKFTAVGKKLTTSVTMPIVAGFTAAGKYASDYEENLNKLDVAFGKNSESVKEWAETARDEFGLSMVQATNAASAFGALGKGIGISAKESADMSMTLAGLTADLGSYFNVGTDEAAKALEGIFTGESEALKKFGVVMTDTNLKQFAEDQGLVWSEMSQTEKTLLRYQYVLEKTKDAQGDFSRTNDGTANSLKIFKATMQDLATNIGTQLLPIITPVIQKISELVSKISELPPFAQKTIVIIGLIAAAIGPLLVVIGAISSGIGAITGALAGISAPIIAVVAGIGALVAALVFAYNNSVTFRDAVNKLITVFVDNFKPIIDLVIDGFKVLISEIIQTVMVVASQLAPVIQTLMPIIKVVAGLLSGELKRGFTLIIGVVRSVLAIIRSLAIMFNSTFQAVVSIALSAVAKIKSVFAKVRDAIVGPFEKARDAVKGIIDKIKGFFNFTAKSPKIPLPHFAIKPSGWKIGDLLEGKIPSLSIKWYAKGGIFNSPTLAGIGEAGPEAVVPLDKFWRKLEQMQDGDVIVNVYGSDNMSVNELALAVEQRIIEMEKRRKMAWQ